MQYIRRQWPTTTQYVMVFSHSDSKYIYNKRKQREVSACTQIYAACIQPVLYSLLCLGSREYRRQQTTFFITYSYNAGFITEEKRRVCTNICYQYEGYKIRLPLTVTSMHTGCFILNLNLFWRTICLLQSLTSSKLPSFGQ